MEVKIDRVAFSIFGIDIMWYAIIICFGIMAGLFVATKNSKLRNIEEDEISNLLLFALPISVIGARIYYVIFEWENYRGNFLSMINIREGGLAIYGAVIAAVVVVYFFSKYKKIDFRDLADVCAPGLILGQAIGRWGNFINQEAHGTETTLPWAVIIDGKKYHPTFLYESVWNLILLICILLYTKHKKFDGELFLMYMGGYGLGRAFIEGLRTDQLTLGSTGIAVSQVLAFALFVTSLGMIIYKRVTLKKK